MPLPGVRTVLKDRFYSIQRTDTAVGPRVLAIGTRDTANGTGDVQNYDPYYATNEQNVIAAFGLGSHLHKAYLELSAGGAPRVYLVALPSGTDDADLLDTGDDSVFDTAFDAAETVLPDIIVPYGRGANYTDWNDWATPATMGDGSDNFGFVADNSSSAGSSLVKRVAEKCQVITERSHPTFAVMGIAPFVGYESGDASGNTSGSMTAAQVNSHLALANLYDHNSDGNTYGAYVSVVATELKPIGYPVEFGWANGACSYAGAISQMDSWMATTGSTALNVQGLRYNLNRAQQQNMIDKGVVPVALDFTRAPLWIDGVTFGKATSDFTRLSTLRITFDVVRSIRLASRGFIGKPASLENRNALETAITGSLRGLQQLGALLGADFVVTYIPRENKAVVDLVIQPAFEIRNIELSISLQL